MLTELLDDLSENVNKKLFRELIDEYRGIKSAYYSQNYELVLAKAGKFVEITFQLLSDIAFNEIPEKPDFDKIFRKLENIPEKDMHTSIRILIPRVALTVYTIRSKRGAVHINKEVSPNYIDCTFVVSSCDWILSELLRILLAKDHDEILRIINGISKIHIPIVEEIKGEPVILEPKMTAKEQILILLLQKYPNFVQRTDLKAWVKGKSVRQINRALSDLIGNSLIFENREGLTLTAKGILEAEKVQIKYYGVLQ
jgi:hypothetical protein